MNEYWIGLDIGTSSIKAALFDNTGSAAALATRPVTMYSPQPGWAEQDPLEWWQAVQEVLRQVLQAVDPAHVVAIGLAGQCPSQVLVDHQGQPLGRALIWRDQRAQAEMKWINENLEPAQAMKWTGSYFTDGASLPPARLLWLKTHRHQDWVRTQAIVQPKDFIGQCLTGMPGTDVYSSYCLVDPATASYHPDFFHFLDVPLELLPPVHSPTATLGHVSAAAARLTGLHSGTPVIIGTIDAWCDSLAGGAIFPGQAVDVCGTSEFICLGCPPHPGGNGVFAGQLDPQSCFVGGPTQAGAESLRWLARSFYPEMASTMDFERLEGEAAAAPAGCSGLVFLPYLDGERSPLWDSTARAVFFGLTLEHGRPHYTRAVYEGVAFAVRHILETCQEVTGQSAQQVTLCGGGSASPFWNQIKADILNKPILRSLTTATTCLGAAMLAKTGVGLSLSIPDACRSMLRLSEPLMPRPDQIEKYEKNYRLYRALYPALKGQFGILSG